MDLGESDATCAGCPARESGCQPVLEPTTGPATLQTRRRPGRATTCVTVLRDPVLRGDRAGVLPLVTGPSPASALPVPLVVPLNCRRVALLCRIPPRGER